MRIATEQQQGQANDVSHRILRSAEGAMPFHSQSVRGEEANSNRNTASEYTGPNAPEHDLEVGGFRMPRDVERSSILGRYAGRARFKYAFHDSRWDVVYGWKPQHPFGGMA